MPHVSRLLTTSGPDELFERFGKSLHLNPTAARAVQGVEEEVVIRNPTHPLFGKQFRVHHRQERPGKEPSVFLIFSEELLLRVPVSALTEPVEPPTKLTLTSMAELVSAFRVVSSSCPSMKPLSGPPSQTT